MHETTVHKTASSFMKTASFCDFETRTFLCYEIHASWFLSSWTSFATNFISSFVKYFSLLLLLLFYWPSISNSQQPIMHAHHAESFAFGSNNWANPLVKPSLKYIDMKEQMWRLSSTNFWVCTYCLLKQSQIEQLHTLDNYSLTSSTQQFGKGPKLQIGTWNWQT